jgi:hypothetical protein
MKSTIITAAGMVLLTLVFLVSAFAQVSVSTSGGGTTAAEQSAIAAATAHAAATTAAHGLAAGIAPVGASGAQTLYGKTLDANTTIYVGSATQNFSVATLTFSNASAGTLIVAHKSAAVTTDSLGTPVLMVWDTPVTDMCSEMIGATFTTKLSGCRKLRASVSFQSTGTNTGFAVNIYKNNTLIQVFNRDFAAGAMVNHEVSGEVIVPVSVGDALTVKVWSSGGTANTTASTQYNSLSIEQIR